MFLVQDSSELRETKIKKLLEEEHTFAVLLAATHFEWTVKRAITALGSSSNIIVRQKLAKCHGTNAYKELWQEEVYPKTEIRLTEVVKNWNGLVRAFKLRNRLAHGVSSCGRDYAKERVMWAIEAARDLRSLCELHGVDLDSHLPVRIRVKNPVIAAVK